MKDKFTVLSIFSYVLFLVLINNLTVSYEGVESAGKNMPFDGEENPNYGKAYVLESDDYVEKALALTDAYSNLDKETFTSLIHERMLPFADQMDDQESYSWKPWSMIPLRRVDDNGAFVVSWSYDESVQDNGSKSATHYIDVLRFNDEDGGKLSGMWSTYRPDPENSEYGLAEGGKFVGRNPENEWSGRPFVFSNRGEVEKLESMLALMNDMDTDGALEYFTNPFTFNDSEVAHENLKDLIAGRKSQNWDAWAMIPIKIKDTDPQSGLVVWATARVETNEGDVWEADVSETYFFDLDGKISSVTQYAKPLSSTEDSEE